MPVQNVSLQTLRAASQAREMAEKRAEVRRKSLLILVHNYLDSEGFPESARQLASESRLSADNFAVCDSDLPSVLYQYEQWFVDKYDKYPRFAKRVTGKTDGGKTPNGLAKGISNRPGPPGDILDPTVPNFRKNGRRSLPRTSQNGGLSRYSSDPNLVDEGTPNGGAKALPRGRGSITPNMRFAGGRNSRNNDGDNRKRDDLNRRPVLSRRSPGDEKKDSTKSSSDSDISERPNRSASSQGSSRNGPVTAARMGQTVIDLKSMISDYTKLEDNIGDIGTGSRAVPKRDGDDPDNSDLLDDRLVKPAGSSIPPHFTGDMKELALAIQREVVVENPSVKWDDVLGVEDAKRLLKEAVVYPLKYPQLFVGRFKPWRGVLLYGPPGTGKTLLAKAVATECKTTFFNISATTLVSKWRGDSEKLVRVLFEMARYYSPSTIFVDEVDALMGSRAGDQEHEASRRMKTQLLVEMDGLTATNDHVFLLAASNIPWELDPAMLRRLEKRILVPLPCASARLAMFKHHLPEVLSDLADAGQVVKTELDYEKLAQDSEGYSGSDLSIVCREAAMTSLRKVFRILEDHTLEDDELPDLQLEEIKMADVETALSRTKPAQQDSEQYRKWHEKFGSE